VNVSNNVITYTAPIKPDIPKQTGGNEEFKKALDDNAVLTKDSTNDNVDKTNNDDKTSDKTEIQDTSNVATESASNDVKSTIVEGDTTVVSDGINTSKDVGTEITDVIKKIIDLLKQNIDGSSKALIMADNNKGSTEIINEIKKIIDELKQNVAKTSKKSVSEGTNKTSSSSNNIKNAADGMSQIMQLLQSLSSMIQSINKTTVTTSETKLNSVDLIQLGGGEQLVGGEQLIGSEKLTSDSKSMVKSNLSDILSLLQATKGNSDVSTQILEKLQKLTTQVEDSKGDLGLLKVTNPQIASTNTDGKSIKDNLIKMVMKQSTTSETISKNSMESSSNSKGDSKSSENGSSDDKFLKNLLSGDKADTKISKVVSFMNQFETVKTIDTTKVQNTDLVINKNNIEVDVIKSVKFMELNNIKDLTVKMNPKELGEITIKLTMESGIMKASISAQNKDTYNLLNHNIQDISDRLKNMDIKIQSLDINVYEDSTFFSKDSSQRGSNGGQNNNTKTNNASQEEDVSINNNYVIEDNQVNKFV